MIKVLKNFNKIETAPNLGNYGASIYNKNKKNTIMNNKNTNILHNEDIEISVLGTVVWLCNNEKVDVFHDAGLTTDLFYTPKNAILFGVIRDLILSGKVPDKITITEKVLSEGISEVTPVDVVVRTEWYVGQELNFDEHVRILKDLTLRRKTQLLAQQLANGCTDWTVDICELVNEADRLKSDASSLVCSSFSPYYKGADKNRIRELLSARGQNLSTGYHFGTEELMIAPKALTFIVGATGHCKTTFLLNLALRVCEKYPEKKVLILSYEEALENVYVNLLNITAKVELGNNNRNIITNHTIADGDLNKLPIISKAEYDDYSHFLENKQNLVEFREQETKFYKLIEHGRLNVQYVDFAVDSLTSFIIDMRRKGLCDIVFIDYIQLLNAPLRSKYHSREDELKEICVNLKNLAVDEQYGLPIVFGAQFNRQVKSAKDLLTTNIGEAGDIERIANTIVGLWNCQKTEDPGTDERREEIAKYQGTKEYNSSAIFAKILKRRGYSSGLTSTFQFEGNTGRILDKGDATTEEINYSII